MHIFVILVSLHYTPCTTEYTATIVWVPPVSSSLNTSSLLSCEGAGTQTTANKVHVVLLACKV